MPEKCQVHFNIRKKMLFVEKLKKKLILFLIFYLQAAVGVN